jgi:hypothetical protein
VSHNRRINGVVLSNGHRAWYDISHTDGWGGIWSTVLSSGKEVAIRKNLLILIIEAV